MRNWQFYRDQLIKDSNHIEFSKDYLSSLKTIRAFVASGDGGFGNIACLVHILQRLTELNFQGDFEIIGPDWTKRKKSPLLIIMSLMNIQVPYSSGKELSIEKDGIKFKFLSLTDFQKRKVAMPQVELAIFAGILRFFNTDYDFFTYHIEDKLCSISKSRKAIFFSPFTIVDDADNIGFIGQVQDQFAVRHYQSLALSYQFIPGAVQSALKEVNFLRESNPLYAENLEKIIIGRHEKKITTFAIYGVHGLHAPQNSIYNLCLAAMNTEISKKNKPLVIILLSSIHDSSWQQMLALFNNSKIEKLVFTDFTRNDRLPNLSANQSVLVRLNLISMGIFEYLLSSSTISPVIEGANAGNVLKNADPPLFGLLCAFYRPPHIFSPKLPAEYYFYPEDLQKSIHFICVTRYQFEKQWSNPGISCPPCEYISPLMDKYSHPNLRLPLSPPDDRVAKAISIVAQAPYCQDLSPYQKIRQCTLQGQLASSFISGSISLLAYTAGKGFFYGCLESVVHQYLQRKYQLPAATAQFYARFFQLLLQGLMEAEWAFEDFYKVIWRMVLTGKNVVAILPALMLLIFELNLNASDGSNVKWIAKTAVNSLMFLAGIWPYFYGGSFKILLLALPMMLLFVSSQNCGRYIGHQVYEKVTIFAENKCRRKPAETIEDQLNLNKQV